MKPQEIVKEFEFDRKTLTNWENANKKGRKLLYEVLKRLPTDFVNDVKKQLEEEERIKESLKKE